MIFITESWLRYDFPDSLVLSKTSYSLFRKNRPDGYGGVAVFVSNLLKVVSIDIPCMHAGIVEQDYALIPYTESLYHEQVTSTNKVRLVISGSL